MASYNYTDKGMSQSMGGGILKSEKWMMQGLIHRVMTIISATIQETNFKFENRREI